MRLKYYILLATEYLTFNLESATHLACIKYAYSSLALFFKTITNLPLFES